MKLTNEWFSAAAEAEKRFTNFYFEDKMNDFRLSKKYNERVEIYWKYEPHYNGMPSEEDGKLTNRVLEVLQSAFEKVGLLCLRASTPATANAHSFSTHAPLTLPKKRSTPLCAILSNFH